MFQLRLWKLNVIVNTLIITSAVMPSFAVPPTSTAHLIEQVHQADTSLIAIKQQIAALEHASKYAGAWENPTLSFDYSNMPIDSWIPGNHPMSGLQFSLKQSFLFPGKQGLREDVIKGKQREITYELSEQRWQLRATVLKAYYQLALVRHLRQINERHISLSDQFIKVVKVKYEVGRTGQHQLLRLQLLGQKLHDELQNFERDEHIFLAAINAARRKPLDHTVTTPDHLAVAKATHTHAKLLKQAILHRPQLKKLLQVEKTRLTSAKLGAREGYPDLIASAGYRLRSANTTDQGTDFVSLGLSLPIPIFYHSRASAKEQQQGALARSARAQWQTRINELRAELAGAVAIWKRAVSEAATYRTKFKPLAQQALDATFAAYQVDRAEFSSLFQAEIDLLTIERNIRLAEARTHLQRVKIEALIGTTLTTSPTRRHQ